MSHKTFQLTFRLLFHRYLNDIFKRGRFVAMKYLNCFLIKVFVLTTNGYNINVDVDKEIVLCAAINSILNLDVLSAPTHIQFMDKTFTNCIKPNHTTFLANVCISETASISKSTLVIVESEELLLKINFGCINHNGHHLIVIRNQLNGSRIREVVNAFYERFLIDVTFLVIRNSQISLQTYIPFNDAKCNDRDLQMINQYDEHTLQWTNEQFFPLKLRNFYNCRLKVATYKNVVPYIVREEYVNGKRILTGRVIEMINALAQMLNFTTDLDYHPSVSAYETCIQKVASREADLFIGNVFLDAPRIKYLDFSIPIFFEFLKFVVPPGSSYSQFENLVRTFDNLTWILILCVFLSSAAIVFIINIRSNRLKIAAFGAGYRNASMDFISDILGMSRMSMPSLTIPRLIIVKFVIFSFVIRTLYQASLFKFLQSDGRYQPAQSVDEIIGRGFTVYSLTLYENYLNLSSHKHAR